MGVHEIHAGDDTFVLDLIAHLVQAETMVSLRADCQRGRGSGGEE